MFIELGNIFFERFTGRFPTEQILNVAKQLWQKLLKDFSDDQLNHAILNCRKWEKDFAPTLPEFISMIPKVQNFGPAGVERKETEEEQKKRCEVGKYWIVKIREILSRSCARQGGATHLRG